MSITEIFRKHAVIVDGVHVNGTDKQSNHNYGPAYEKLFAGIDARLFLEVGITDGSCLRAWQEVFPTAKIIGLDIHPCADKSFETHVGDQRSKADCERAVRGRLFDVILEDAYHSTENTLLTLFWLWPYVKPGGLYIIEEWADIGNSWHNIKELFGAEIIPTQGPFGGNEPLVVLRKPHA